MGLGRVRGRGAYPHNVMSRTVAFSPCVHAMAHVARDYGERTGGVAVTVPADRLRVRSKGGPRPRALGVDVPAKGLHDILEQHVEAPTRTVGLEAPEVDALIESDSRILDRIYPQQSSAYDLYRRQRLQ